MSKMYTKTILQFKSFLVVSTVFILTCFVVINAFGESLNTSTFSCAIPLTRTTWDTREDTQLQPCILQKFDTGLGSLTHVTLSLSQLSQGELGVENTTSQAQSISPVISTHVNFYDPENYLLHTLTTSQNYNFSIATYDNMLDFEGESGSTVAYNTQSTNQTFTFTDAVTLDQYSNSLPGLIETTTLHASAETNIESTEFSNSELFLAIDSRASAQVFYTYTTGSDIDTSQETELLRSGGLSINSSTLSILLFATLSLLGVKISFFEQQKTA